MVLLGLIKTLSKYTKFQVITESLFFQTNTLQGIAFEFQNAGMTVIGERKEG